MSRFSIVKDKILDDLESLVEELYRASRRPLKGGTWNIVNPYRPKAKADQMVVWLRGGRRGAWKDFVSGEKGDAIDLVAFALAGSVTDLSRKMAVDFIEDRFGLREMDPARRRAMEMEAKSRRLANEAKELERREKSISRARRFFFSCGPIAGTAAETYLASRGAPIDTIPNLGRSLRFRPDCEYWRLDGKPKLPAMISAMVDHAGQLCACHYTFLLPDGSGKAAVPKAKMMFPETSGLVIRLTNGESGLSAEDAAEQDISGFCALCEGIEDGASIARANPELRVWPAGSLSGLLTVPDHKAVSGWLIFKDNDWGKPQATALFNRAVARIKSFGKPVEVIAMPASWGKDVNDAINGGEW